MKLVALAVVSSVTVLALTGCSVVLPAADPTPAATAAKPTPSSGTQGMGAKDGGGIPDPCTLLDESEVEQLTGRTVTQIDKDGEDESAAVRYCQWQQDGGQVAVFVNRTTEAEFETGGQAGEKYDGVGDEAYTLGGHLFVRYGAVSIDVYSRGDDTDAQNYAKAETIADAVMPGLA